MASIDQLSVLVVDDDSDSTELLELLLGTKGATVKTAASAEQARAVLKAEPVDVILTDVGLPGEDGFEFVARLRADPSTRRIPAIAVTGHADARSRLRALEGGFQKFITKPLDVFALPAAIASVVAAGDRTPPAETDDERIARLVAGYDMQTLLATLNAATSYRYTSVLRFDGERLESVWTVDRTSDTVDTFPPDTPVSASYCSLVRAQRAPVYFADSLADARVGEHVKRSALRAYCGVPIHRADGTMFGTLCHYDEEPRLVLDGTVTAMKRVAEVLSAAMPAESAARVDRTKR